MGTVHVEFSVAVAGRSEIKGRVAVLQLEPVGESKMSSRVNNVRAPIGKSAFADVVKLNPGKYVARLKLPTGEHLVEVVDVHAKRRNQKVLLGKPAPRPDSLRSYRPNAALGVVASRAAGKLIIKEAEAEVLSPLTSNELIGFEQTTFENLALPSLRPTQNSIESGTLVSVPQQHLIESLSEFLTPVVMESASRANPPSHFEFPIGKHGRIRLHSKVDDSSVTKYLDRRRKNLDLGSPNIEIFGCSGSANAILKRFGRTPKGQIDGMQLFDDLGLRLSPLQLHPAKISRSFMRFTVRAGVESQAEDVAYAIMSNAVRNADWPIEKIKTKLIRLPGPWRLINGTRCTNVNLEIKMPVEGSPAINIAVDDPEIQSVIDFLQQKDLNAAMTVLERSVDILMHKLENPYAAAAAGYVLVQAPDSRIPNHWYEWIGNLGQRFKDLPDGLILHATLLLQRALSGPRLPHQFFPDRANERIQLAADLILRALQRGLPLYRSGFSHLATDLNILEGREELSKKTQRSIAQASRMVHAMRLRLDATQPFTVIDIPTN